MSINELSHSLLFLDLFIASLTTRNNHQCFGAAPAFWCILVFLLGLSFRHIPNNLFNKHINR